MNSGSLAGLGLVTLVAAASFAETANAADVTKEPSSQGDVKSDVPILTYTYQATGASAGSVGVQAYGLGAGASGGVGINGPKQSIVGGGVTVWGSPVDRLTLIGDAARDATGNFAPSAAAVVRLFGRADDGFSMGAIGKYKIDGFGVGPENEVESEMEGGLLFSYAKYRWHFDLNTITGFGTGQDGEVDTEGRLRIGRDVGRLVRIGIDGEARYRLAGAAPLVGNRKGDFTGGPQVMIGTGHFFGALTAGPTTMNVFDGVGWAAVATIGGSTL